MIALKYILFAAISTAFNLFTQWASLQLYQGILHLPIAMFLGTLTGLIIKYWFDKHYIFEYTTQNHKEDRDKFILYTFIGGFTTLIFWGTEYIFNALINESYAKYLGAIIGLSIGYTLKYHIDKKYVFIQK